MPLAASLEAYLPSVGHPFTASDEDGDGYNDTFMISFDDGQGTTIEAWCQCFDGIARVICDMGAVSADADAGTVCQVVNALNSEIARPAAGGTTRKPAWCAARRRSTTPWATTLALTPSIT